MPLSAPFSPADGPLFLMDGTAYIYRGYYANSALQRSDGFPTGAITVVSRILLRILRREKPRFFAFFKDGHGHNFRHEIYPEYKANRQAMPDALACQMEPVRRMVEALGLRFEESDGCEADDCIASLAHRFSPGLPVVIVSADKDLRQCLSPRVSMWDPGSKDEKIWTDASVAEETGIPVRLWADMQALTGDPVDNIPGVPGIGPKTAVQILRDFPGLEEIRDRFALISPKHQKKLQGHLEDMFLWRRLTSLSTTQCEGRTLEDLAVRPPDMEKAMAIAREFEMRALMQDIQALGRERGGCLSAVRRASPAGASGGQAVRPEAGTRKPEGPAAPDRDEGSLVTAAPGLSLADLARSSTVSALPSLTEPSALPDCEGARLAVIWPDGPGGPCTAACRKKDGGQEEFLWAGGQAPLAAWAEKSESLALEDVKTLLAPDSPWREELRRRCLEGGVYDLGLAAYLFSPEEYGYSWSRLVGQASLPLGEEEKGPGGVALALEDWGRARLERDGLAPLYHNLELPLVPVLADMERQGVRIDMEAFQIFLGEVRQELSLLTQKVYDEAGGPFNLRSSQQLAEVLYTKLGLTPSRRTRGGLPSTSQEALERLAGHPLVDAVLRCRRLEKMRSTYLEPLPRLTDAEGRLHTTFNQEATATGRLSSSSPNLQNIPVRGALGRRMRSCFVAGEGQLLISCDYSQIELRVLAAVSRDQALLTAFADGEDIHARTAALLYDCEPSLVTPDQRRNAKTINFGLIYGMGAQKLAREIGVTATEAKAFIQRYFARLTGLKEFYERVDSEARRDGFVTTLGGRRRLLPGIRSDNAQEQALARRQAVNTVIQGSAADIIKMAMLAVWRDEALREMDARMLLQVHDELVLEAPADRAEEAARRVVELMEGVQPAGTPFVPSLKVDWGVGGDWGSAH